MPRPNKGVWGDVSQLYLDTIASWGAPPDVIQAEKIIDGREHIASCALVGKPNDWPDIVNYDYQNLPYLDEPDWERFNQCIVAVTPHIDVLHNYWKNTHSQQIRDSIRLIPLAVNKARSASSDSEYKLWWRITTVLREVWRCGVIYLTWDVLPELQNRGFYGRGNLKATRTIDDIPRGVFDTPTPPVTPELDIDLLPEFTAWVEARENMLAAETKFLEEIGRLLAEYDVLVTKK